ncbi:MAG: hypothetical protein WCL10_02715 [Novosphingobium sp.]|jgi:hypothetical protein
MAHLIGGMINIALFTLPVPLLAWLDRPKAPAEPLAGQVGS